MQKRQKKTTNFIFAFLVADVLQRCKFDCQLSPGDFVTASKETSKKPGPDEKVLVEVAKDVSTLFSCAKEGCVKVYERYSSLEKHMSFGKCEMIPEKETLLDKAKITYHTLLRDDDSSARAFTARETRKTDGVSLPEGWALKIAKKSARFNEAQRKYLEEKFNIGQQTGRKQNPEQVARDMRFAKKADGSRLFSSDEFLTTQQIQSFFSRLASKLRHAVEVSDSDIRAAQEEQEYYETHQAVLDEVQLQHPIAYDNLNLCELNKKGSMKTLSLAMLKSICDFFGASTDGFHPRRKAEYLSVLRDLLEGCSSCGTSV